jgi:hypothetical protein
MIVSVEGRSYVLTGLAFWNSNFKLLIPRLLLQYIAESCFPDLFESFIVEIGFQTLEITQSGRCMPDLRFVAVMFIGRKLVTASFTG